jgi:hypothetical protein
MQLKWGSYGFEANTSLIATRREVLWNAGGQAYADRRSFDVQGVLTASGQAALSIATAELEAALLVQNAALILYQDDGVTPSATFLLPTGSTTGVRVTRGPNFESTQGPEYATERKFTCTFEAEYALTSNRLTLLEFTESITFSGGGPLYSCVPALQGPPIRFRLYDQTPYRAIQKGSATGYLDYPVIPGPIWPAALKQAPEITPTGPKRQGQAHTGFVTSWVYEYESPFPLAGNPNVWSL